MSIFQENALKLDEKLKKKFKFWNWALFCPFQRWRDEIR
jgi:hypothetical protein